MRSSSTVVYLSPSLARRLRIAAAAASKPPGRYALKLITSWLVAQPALAAEPAGEEQVRVATSAAQRRELAVAAVRLDTSPSALTRAIIATLCPFEMEVATAALEET